jgi:hypothetical protein
MNKRNWGELTNLILSAVKEYGPMTRAEIKQHIGAKHYEIGGHISRMTRAQKQIEQRLHISGYIRDHEGARRYLRPVYALGPGQNAKKPTNYQKRERVEYDQMRTNIVRNASVFNLGLRRDDIREMRKNVRPTEVHLGQGS